MSDFEFPTRENVLQVCPRLEVLAAPSGKLDQQVTLIWKNRPVDGSEPIITFPSSSHAYGYLLEAYKCFAREEFGPMHRYLLDLLTYQGCYLVPRDIKEAARLFFRLGSNEVTGIVQIFNFNP